MEGLEVAEQARVIKSSEELMLMRKSIEVCETAMAAMRDAYHPHLAEGLPTVDEYRAIPPFYYFSAGPRAQERATQFGDQIADLVMKHGGGNKRLAIDELSHLGVDAIRSHGIEVPRWQQRRNGCDQYADLVFAL